MESFEHMGDWWLPNDDTNAKEISGKLSFNPESGGLLELMGDFADPWSESAATHFEIIHGAVLVEKRGKYLVTLRDCYVNFSDGVGARRKTNLQVNYIYWTSHFWFNNADDIQFEKIVVDYTYLNDWMPQNNFTSNLERHDKKHMFIKYVRYNSGEPLEIQLDNAKIEIESALRSEEGPTEVSLKQLSRFNITPREKLHFDEYLQIIDFHLPGFLTFATGHANYPLSVEGQLSGDLGVIRIHIYYGIPGYKNKKRALGRRELLFSFRDVQDELPKYLSRWIGKSEKLRTVLELYFKSHYERYWDMRTQFLDLARALEAYHRNLYGGKYLSKEEYQPIKNTLIEAIPKSVGQSHEDALRGSLEYGYQYSFRTRLKRVIKEILSEHQDNVRSFVGQPSVFIHKVVQVRNRLTHPDESSDERKVTPDELRDLIPKVKMLLRICFLVEIEFPPAEITRLLNENQEYLQLTKDE